MTIDWLYEKVSRVPDITDEQIAEMRHIEPVLRSQNSGMYRRIKDVDTVDPRYQSFLWNAEPTGEEFTFDVLNQTEVITQHHSSVFFKPSLAEVYAWIRVYLGDQWNAVKYFCLHDPARVGASSDIYCFCTLLGGPVLVRGKEITFPGGGIGHELVIPK